VQSAAIAKTPALILDAENDQFLKGQPEILHAALKCTKRLVTLTNAEGAGAKPWRR
jgi:hypothetical protein